MALYPLHQIYIFLTIYELQSLDKPTFLYDYDIAFE